MTEPPGFLLGPVRSVLWVQTNGGLRVALGGGSHGLHSPLGTAAQFLYESPSFLWAPGIPEPCTFKQGRPEETEGRGGESASVLTQLDDR